ncbi:MAG: prepilin-type N-terminal cleavage/methylation domain-containing protein, partial [Planctomycetota bacterium]
MVRRRTTMRGAERAVRTRYGYTLIEIMIVLTVLGGL